MFSHKFIQRFLKACQVVFLTGNTIKAGNNFDIKMFPSLSMLQSDLKTFWREFNEIRQKKYADLKPNLGHYALVDLEERFEDFTLITTAIDGLHSQAGNKKLIELNGNIWRNICLDCHHRFMDNLNQEIPQCPKCGSKNVRPDVAWHEEVLDARLLREAQGVAAEAEIFVTAGFDDAHSDIRALPLIARANGAYLLELNPEKTEFSKDMDEILTGNPAKLLTAIVLILEKIQ